MLKRISSLASMLTIASMLLVACGGEATPTPTTIVAPTAAATDTAGTTGAPTNTSGTTSPTNTAGTSTGTKPNLAITWFAWAPCDALASLSKTYADANVTVNCVPIGEWRSRIFDDFIAKGGSDLVVLDSQFIGEAVVGNHVADLTDWMKTNIEMDDFVPAALSAYGEYPLGSGKYYGVAAEGDTQMLVYRKDLMDNPAFQTDFKAAKNRDLALPKKWTELLDIAQVVKQNAGKYNGIQNGYTTHWCGTPACYDQMATHWNQILWSFGGELWDPKTYRASGQINSETAVRALEFDKQLFQTGPEGQSTNQFDQTVSALCDGTTAMTTIWFGFGPAFADPKGCAQSANLAYAMVPGEDKHFISLGGMGMSVSNYTKNRDASLAFLKWFESKETQIEWAKVGGFSARKSVLASDEFKNAAPYNPTFAESYLLVKDFWNIPEYAQLLPIQMEQLNAAVSGLKTPKEALDQIASEQDAIFTDKYPSGAPK